MSEDGLHSHAPHEEAISHAAGGHGNHDKHGLGQWVAIFTAILASFGAVVSYQGNSLMNEVLLYKNEAVLARAKASDQWNYYQAVSTKLRLMELAVELAPAKVAHFKEKIAKYTAQKTRIQPIARALERASDEANATAARLSRPHNNMAIAMIFLQIAISLASITALTRRKWLFATALVAASGGLVLWLLALFMN